MNEETCMFCNKPESECECTSCPVCFAINTNCTHTHAEYMGIIKRQAEQIERLMQLNTQQAGENRELQMQLASTPEEMRQNAESHWLAGMSGTWYDKLQKANADIDRLTTALTEYADKKNWTVELDKKGRAPEYAEKCVFRPEGDGYTIARKTLGLDGDK